MTMIRQAFIALLALAATAIAAPAGADEPAAPRPADPTAACLRDGGYVLYIRHGKTNMHFCRPDWQPELVENLRSALRAAAYRRGAGADARDRHGAARLSHPGRQDRCERILPRLR